MSSNAVLFTAMCSGSGVISYGGHNGQPPYKGGDVITFHCDDGYTLNGNSVLTCQVSGIWDKPFPNCIPLSGKYNNRLKTSSISPL